MNADQTAAMLEELRRAWIRSGLTLREVGERMGGRYPQGVHDLLNRRSDVRLSSLLPLADVLGYDLKLVRREDT